MALAGGTRKALVVGINYIGSRNELRGCANDARNVRRMLLERFGFHDHDVRLLIEDQAMPSLRPTRRNIIAGLQWLVSTARSGDVLFFHYSGHGSQIADTTGTEPDGRNECLCPLDVFEEPWPARIISDNELHSQLYGAVPVGVMAYCIFDCCHSGSMADLLTNGGVTDASLASLSPRGGGTNQTGGRYLDPPAEVKASILAARARRRTTYGVAQKRVVPPPGQYVGKLLWTFSGCQDFQTSADSYFDHSAQGAFTWALLAALKEGKYQLTCHALLEATKAKLRSGKFEQVPVLTCQVANHFFWPFLGSGAPSDTALSPRLAAMVSPAALTGPHSPNSPRPPCPTGTGGAFGTSTVLATLPAATPTSPGATANGNLEAFHYTTAVSSTDGGGMLQIVDPPVSLQTPSFLGTMSSGSDEFIDSLSSFAKARVADVQVGLLASADKLFQKFDAAEVEARELEASLAELIRAASAEDRRTVGASDGLVGPVVQHQLYA
eukprot:TRINITY_DN26802_c0_g2_i1.p1 TRINITY_DN26802_c0_g2~~TRINITY_DN26802_c0_g2_i1.p1  ORF type:complete len:495 (-),score=78.44 TRINITY_DN26802_c0_g2_i1:37-1521(-)